MLQACGGGCGGSERGAAPGSAARVARTGLPCGVGGVAGADLAPARHENTHGHYADGNMVRHWSPNLRPASEGVEEVASGCCTVQGESPYCRCGRQILWKLDI